MKIRKGDKVKIISGNDKGKQGKVLSVDPSRRKIVVEGVNLKSKHARPRREGQKGEILKIPAAFFASRVMMVCPSCGKAVRVGRRFTDSSKARICKKCGKNL